MRGVALLLGFKLFEGSYRRGPLGCRVGEDSQLLTDVVFHALGEMGGADGLRVQDFVLGF